MSVIFPIGDSWPTRCSKKFSYHSFSEFQFVEDFRVVVNVVLGTVDEFSAIVTKEQELGSERARRLFFTSFSLVQFSGQHFQGGHVCWARPLRRVPVSLIGKIMPSGLVSGGLWLKYIKDIYPSSAAVPRFTIGPSF